MIKNDIVCMQPVHTDAEGAVSSGDTIDVAPVIFNDGTIHGTSLMRVSYTTLSNAFPAYPWTVGMAGARLLMGNGYGSLLDDGYRTEESLMFGMNMVEMIGEEF